MAPQTKIGARPTGNDAAPAEEAPAKGGKKKLFIIIGGALLVVLLGAAYWFLMGPGKAAPAATEGVEPTAEAEVEYELGEVLVVDAISINLQGGHYLRLGLGLQLVAGAHEAPDTAKALDAAIALYSGLTTEELADLTFREELKDQLAETLKEVYHEDVVDVYYTDFVTQ
jgi:flagellar FliL protein